MFPQVAPLSLWAEVSFKGCRIQLFRVFEGVEGCRIQLFKVFKIFNCRVRRGSLRREGLIEDTWQIPAHRIETQIHGRYRNTEYILSTNQHNPSRPYGLQRTPSDPVLKKWNYLKLHGFCALKYPYTGPFAN